ncbi:cold shock domain-containing protein [Streptomyces sp. NPDC006512]|uniref:cold shock domain-containing protein n=1 Tax=Streptomyces sp. NPDC006512 TaxID=3154307 RepID=UPI0033BD8A27
MARSKVNLFAHYSAIETNGYKTLKAGQALEFEIIAGPRGRHAADFRSASAAGAPDSPA